MPKVTIGQYFTGDSLIHRLDPRVKLIGTFFYIVILFFADSFASYGLAGLFLSVLIILSKVPFKYILRGMRGIIFLLMITILFNLFLTPGDRIWSFYFLSITRQGLEFASMMAIRLFFLIMVSSIMTLTTTPNQLTDAMEYVLNPLKAIRVPVHEIAMMMSIALRFIPILSEETDKIMKAQQARGASFTEGNIFQRAKSLVPILVPLFVSAFRRAGDLAMAMEARCYHGGAGRTKMYPLEYKRLDAVFYAALFLYLAGMTALIILF